MYISENQSEQEDQSFFCNPVLRGELQSLFRQAMLSDKKRTGKDKKRKMTLSTIDLVLKFPAEREKILRTIEKCWIEKDRKNSGNRTSGKE